MIGLIAAMPEESHALLQRIPSWAACRLGTFRGYRFRLGDQDCLLVESGVGMQRAGAASRVLLAESPRMVLSFGVAGAVQGDLRIGDVVAIRQSCTLEQGVTAGWMPLTDLPSDARQAAVQALHARGASLVDGTAVTTRGEQTILEGSAGLENPVLEMETAAIAAAAQTGVPLLALRGISDNPQEPLSLNPAAVLDDEYRLKIAKLLGVLLRHPQILLQMGRLRRNTRLAAENTALAVMAVLDAV